MFEDFSRELECPVTLELLEDPIQVPCCRRYFSRTSLIQVLRCPLCNVDFQDFDSSNAPKEIQIANMVSLLKSHEIKKAKEILRIGFHIKSANYWRKFPHPLTFDYIKLNIDDLSFEERKYFFEWACEQDQVAIARFLYPYLNYEDSGTPAITTLFKTEQGVKLIREILEMKPYWNTKRWIFNGACRYEVLDLVKSRCNINIEDIDNDFHNFKRAAENCNFRVAECLVKNTCKYIIQANDQRTSFSISRNDIEKLLLCVQMNKWHSIAFKLKKSLV